MPGLSSREVDERIRQGLDNEQVSSSTRTIKQIIQENVFTYFNLIFTVLGVLLVIVGSFKDLTFMLIVLANTAIGIAQEIKVQADSGQAQADEDAQVPCDPGRPGKKRWPWRIWCWMMSSSCGRSQIPADAEGP